MLYRHQCLLMIKHWYFWKSQYNKYICLILSTIYIFIPVSGCVYIYKEGPCTLVLLGGRGAMLLLRRPWVDMKVRPAFEMDREVGDKLQEQIGK